MSVCTYLCQKVKVNWRLGFWLGFFFFHPEKIPFKAIYFKNSVVWKQEPFFCFIKPKVCSQNCMSKGRHPQAGVICQLPWTFGTSQLQASFLSVEVRQGTGEFAHTVPCFKGVPIPNTSGDPASSISQTGCSLKRSETTQTHLEILIKPLGLIIIAQGVQQLCRHSGGV